MIRRAFSQSCCTTPAALWFWGLVLGLLLGAGMLAASWQPEWRRYTDTYLMAAIGIACLANFGRHRTFHCGASGPAFILGAGVMAMVETHRWPLVGEVVWAIVLLVVAASTVAELRLSGSPRS